MRFDSRSCDTYISIESVWNDMTQLRLLSRLLSMSSYLSSLDMEIWYDITYSKRTEGFIFQLRLDGTALDQVSTSGTFVSLKVVLYLHLDSAHKVDNEYILEFVIERNSPLSYVNALFPIFRTFTNTPPPLEVSFLIRD